MKLRIAFALLGLALATQLFAQAYPARPVKLVAPFAPGGLADVLSRALGERLQKQLGQPFVVENRPGAGGNVGADFVARSDPDGYTLLMSSAGILTINEFLYPQMTFDPASAFAPVSVVADMPMLLVVRKDLPARDVREFLALAKRQPLFFGSPGHGTTGHLGMELFMHATGVKLQHVPYKSAAEAVQAALAGQTHCMFDNPPTVMAQISSGALRALGVAAKARVERLAAETARSLQDPEMQARFEKLGARLVGNTPAEFAALVEAERKRWGEVIRAARIKLQ